MAQQPGEGEEDDGGKGEGACMARVGWAVGLGWRGCCSSADPLLHVRLSETVRLYRNRFPFLVSRVLNPPRRP